VYRVFCNASPFVFQPIRLLVDVLEYQPKGVYDHLCLRLIDPLNPIYKPYKLISHLTDAQKKEGQVRFLGMPEIDKKLMHLARGLVPHIQQPIRFILSPHFKEVNRLFPFIRYLQMQANDPIAIDLQVAQGEQPTVASYEENRIAKELYFSDESTKKQKAKLLLEYAKECSNAGDYYSAINFLDSVKELELTDKLLEIAIYEHLALCYRLIGNPLRSEFYYKVCLRISSENNGIVN